VLPSVNVVDARPLESVVSLVDERLPLLLFVNVTDTPDIAAPVWSLTCTTNGWSGEFTLVVCEFPEIMRIFDA
jgi:hypothetical protein